MDLRSTILAAQDRRLIETDVPEWGEKVFCGVMSGADRDGFDAEGAALRLANPENPGAASTTNFRARVLVRSLFNAEGERIFSDKDAVLLGKKSGRVLDRLYDIVGPMNGLWEADVKSKAGESVSTASNAVPGSATP